MGTGGRAAVAGVRPAPLRARNFPQQSWAAERRPGGDAVLGGGPALVAPAPPVRGLG